MRPSLIFLPLLALLVTLVFAVTTTTTVFGAVTRIVDYNPQIPLTHCMTFGPNNTNSYQLEWEIQGPSLHLRFTTSGQRGYTAFGFMHAATSKFQIISANPSTAAPCARRLYDNYSPYNLLGNPYENYPETPANMVYENISHTHHYVLRNLTTHAKAMLDAGGSMSTKLSLLWGYGIKSMYDAACYGLNMTDAAEYAELNVTFTDTFYKLSNNNGVCVRYNGSVVSLNNKPTLAGSGGAELLSAELAENTRMAGLLVGGDMLLQTGQNPPSFAPSPTGFAYAGDNNENTIFANVCQSSLTTLKVRWGGFSDSVGGVQRYEITAGTADKPSLYLDRADVGTNEGYTFTGLSMTKNETLYISVSAINFAGLSTTQTIPPMRILNNNAPVFGTVKDGTLAETLSDTVPLQFIRTTSRLSAHWIDYLAHDHSSIDSGTLAETDLGYAVAVGISGQAVDSFLAYASSGSFVTESILTGLTLTHGTKYYFTVRTQTCSGEYAYASSAGVTVDILPPNLGKVFLGNTTGTHLGKIKVGYPMFVTWYGFSDTPAGIISYEWAVGKSKKAPFDTNLLIYNWTTTSSTLARSASGVPINQLSPALQAQVPLGTLLYAYIKVTDRAGNWAVAESNSTTVVGE